MNTSIHAQQKRVARTLLLAFGFLLLLHCLVNAQINRVHPEPDDQVRVREAKPEPTPRAKLRGHVVYDDTGRPVRRARVLLLEDGSTEGTGPSALTNERGDFVIEHVPAGRYFIIVEGPGLLTPYSFLSIEDTQGSDINFNAFRDQFERVSVDGNSDTEVQVRARRGGALTGKVTYENGDPAINVEVTLLRRQHGQLRQYLGGVGANSTGATPTDDRGIFRFTGLPPGEYLISVAEQIEHGNSTGAMEDYEGEAQQGSPLVVTYYPSAARPSEATAIKLVAGEEHVGVDIMLADRGLYTLAGVVKDKQTGRPLRNVHLGIHLKEAEAEEMPLTIDQYTSTDEQGRWQFNELPDGLYVLTAQPQAETDQAAMEAYQTAVRAAVESGNPRAMESLRPPQPVQRFAARQQEIKIEGHDLTSLAVNLSAGGRISGTVVIDSEKASERELPAYLALSAESIGEGPRAAYSGLAVVQNGRFVLGGIQPGKVFFSVNASGEEGGYYVRSITANGVTYTREPLVIADSMTIRGARVVLSPELAKLHGRVSVAGEKERAPVSGAAVVLVPADARQWRWNGAQFLVRTELDGAFTLAAPPGDYLVFVLPATERPRGLSADEIGQFSAGGQRVTLRAGQTDQLELTAPAAK